MNENEIAAVVVDAAYRIHRSIGPGLFESVYHTLLCHEFSNLKVSDLKLGLLINFGEATVKSGITRIVNGLEDLPQHIQT